MIIKPFFVGGKQIVMPLSCFNSHIDFVTKTHYLYQHQKRKYAIKAYIKDDKFTLSKIFIAEFF